MRSPSSLLAVALLLAPAAGHAQAPATRHLSAKQLAERDACIARAGKDAQAVVDCGNAIERAAERDDCLRRAGQDAQAIAACGPLPAPLEPPAAEPPASEPPPESAAPTDAERDYQALYGTPVDDSSYNPVADPTLPAPAQVTGAYDPWEPYNRRMHVFNNAVDRHVARPLARTYVRVTPRPVRLGVSNFFNNLGQPVAMVNLMLQGKPRQAAQSLGRFVLNTTLGIGGIFDPASDAKLPNRSEDFGQTLGVWGWKRSRYLELPLFGPRTVRDALGMFGDSPLSPLRQVEADKIRIPIQGLQLVDVRTQLLSTDSLREGADDDYALVRDAWSQRRDYQIFGDRQLENDQQLPEYLREETNPLVPVDALPVMPPSGG